MSVRLSAINRYPVKSCAGQPLQSATVEPWGLAGDRRWMVVDDEGECVTAREHPRLVLVHAELIAGGVHLSSPDAEALFVPAPVGPAIDVSVFRGPFPAKLATDAAHTWFSKIVGEPCRLVYQHDPTRRPTNPDYTSDADRVSLADGYPMLVTSEASLAALNELIAGGPLPEEAPLPMTRFRPNLVVTGSDAWAEDGWRRVRVGRARFRIVKGCDRCVMTTIDPTTAAKGKEPIATLARHRKWEGKTWFGMNMVPDTPGESIAVGDEVEVIAADEAADGPIR